MKKSLNPENLEDLKKIRKNPEKIRKNPEKIRNPDEIPEKKIIISHLRSKPSNLSRNMVKTAKI